MGSGKAGKASHFEGDTKASKPESHHSVESEWSGPSWSGKSSKKSDLKDLIKFIVVKILVLFDIISFEEAAALSYSKPSLGSWSGKSGKSGHYGLTSLYSKPSLSSLFSGKSGKSGREDKEEDILELLGIFILWLDSLDKTAVEGFISNIVGFLGSLDEATIEGIILGIVAFLEGYGLGLKATPATRDGHVTLPDFGTMILGFGSMMIIFFTGVMDSLPGAPWNAEKFSGLFDEILLLLANLPLKTSGKSGKSGGHYYSKPSFSSLFSGKSGKSGLKDKKEDILELLGIFFLWLESLDKAFIEGIISSIVGFLGGLDLVAIEGIIIAILTALGVPPESINIILVGLGGLIPPIGIAPEDSSVLTELQTEIAEEDLLIANLSMP